MSSITKGDRDNGSATVTRKVQKLLISAAVFAVVVSPCLAGSSIQVSGHANIFGAGHSIAPDPAGGGGGTLPPSVSFTWTADLSFQFTVTGSVSPSGIETAGPDGGFGPTNIDSFDGVSGIQAGNAMFLVGVFLDDTTPANPAPPRLDFSEIGTNFTVLNPTLGQVFFIGDGLTGTGSGAVQKFIPPQGSTRLFLGVADGGGRGDFDGDPGFYGDNSGNFIVTLGLGPPPISLHRLSAPGDAEVDPESTIDDVIMPTADKSKLAALPVVAKGLVADDVTPLVIRIDTDPGSGIQSVHVQFLPDSWSGGSIAASSAFATPDSRFLVLSDGDWEYSQDVPIDQASGTGYAMISGVPAEDLIIQNGSAGNTELSGMLLAAGSNLVTGAVWVNTTTIKFRKPPLVLVHGFASNSDTWSSDFINSFTSYGREVIRINYGPVDVPVLFSVFSTPTLRASFGSLQDLASDLNGVLAATETTSLPNADWAWTKYDVLGHSQGGILLRMLSVAKESAKFFGGQQPFRNLTNFDRGRFRRVITIASPHNGAVLTTYASEAFRHGPSFGITLDGNLMLSYMHYTGLLAFDLSDHSKFDPFGIQISLLNDSHYIIDQANVFHLVAGQVNSGAPPGRGPAIPAYYLLGLSRTVAVGQAILPNGSDGVVEPESALGDAFPGTTYAERWTASDSAHLSAGLPYLNLFGGASSETSNPAIAAHLASLLENPKGTAFGSFPHITLRKPDQEQAIRNLVPPALFKSEITPRTSQPASPSVEWSKSLNSTRTKKHVPASPTAQADNSSSYSFYLNTDPATIQSGTIFWSAYVYGPVGLSVTGLTVTVDPNDPQNASLSVDNTVIGEVVITASYTASDGSVIYEQPIIVTSIAPSGTYTGIELRPATVQFAVGGSVDLEIWRDYSDGTSSLAYVSAGAATLTSDSNAVRVIQDLAMVADAPGTATLTAQFEGFTAQMTATISGFPPLAVNDTAIGDHKLPVSIAVLDNDKSFSNGTLSIQSTTQPSFGSVSVSGTNVIYTPAPLPAGVTSDSFTYRVADSGGSLNDATVTVQRPVPPDDQPPALTLPFSPIVAEATSGRGANVNFAVSATDPEDGDITPQTSSNDGDLFPLGTTTVTCVATDFFGVSCTGSFNVLVKDTTPPVITIAGDDSIRVDPGTPYVDAGATAVDLVSGSIPVISSGTVDSYTLGTYTINYSATDTAGNSATATRTVIVAASQGTLDKSFGANGVVTTSVGSSDTGRGGVVQSDGKILVGGYSSNGVTGYEFALARYNSDGTLDTTFNGTGKVTTDIGGSADQGNSIALQTDGKIVVAGSSYNGGNYDFAVVRYNTDGSLDTTFNGTGKVTTDIGGSHDYGYGVVVQSDGKLVVAGSSYNGRNYDFAVVRYNKDGTLDAGFNGNGKVTTAIGGGNDEGYGVTLQSDGKIVVTGYTDSGGRNFDIALARYNLNGSLDTTFNGNGKVKTDISSDDGGQSVVVQIDGKIVVAGYAFNDGNNSYDFALVRYNPDGTLDTGFNGTGKVTTDIGGTDDFCYAVAVQGDGKILAAGSSRSVTNGHYDFALIRYNPDGSLDTAFNNTGKVTTSIGSRDDQGYGVAIQSDGKIIVAGYSDNGGGDTNFALVRYGIGDPLIFVDQPLGIHLEDGASTVSFGDVVTGGNASLEFTIRNLGAVNLGGLGITLDGTNSGEFTIIAAPSTIVASGASALFTVRFAPTTPGAKTAGLHISSNVAGSSNPFDISLTGTGLTSLEDWRRIYFGSPDNTGDGADLSDYDHDGIVNVVEYAFGLNPKQNSAGQIPTAKRIGNSFVISFTEPSGVSGITYGAQSSTTLAPGSWAIVADTGSWPQHIFSVPIGNNTKLFMQLVVTVQ